MPEASPEITMGMKWCSLHVLSHVRLTTTYDRRRVAMHRGENLYITLGGTGTDPESL